jgi:hypothetical protein
MYDCAARWSANRGDYARAALQRDLADGERRAAEVQRRWQAFIESGSAAASASERER